MSPRPGLTVPRLSVIVPHRSDLANLDLCLGALQRQTLPRSDFEIVVADNASPEGCEAVEAVIAGRARLVMVSEKGAGPARNGGVAASRGAILAFTDSDCRPEPRWLEAGVAALDHADIAGGAMTVLVADPAHPTPTEAFERLFAFDNARYVRAKGFTVTANLFCRRSLFEQVGGFRVGLSEDTEWAHRARAMGFSIGYAPEAVVAHPARRDWPGLKRKWRRIQDESFALALTRPGGRRRWLLKALALPLSAVAHAGRPLASPRLAGAGQRLGALAILFRLRFWRAWDSLRLLARG